MVIKCTGEEENRSSLDDVFEKHIWYKERGQSKNLLNMWVKAECTGKNGEEQVEIVLAHGKNGGGGTGV